MMITNYYRDEVLPVAEPPPGDIPRPTAPAAQDTPGFLTASQQEAADDIRRSLAEQHVYAAVTGAPGVGKTALLAAVTAAHPGPAVRVLRLDHPDRISVDQAMQTERMMTAPASARPGGHTVLIVDDADQASAALLRCLTRVAEGTRMRQGSPQLVLAGRPELWDRLAADEFTPLRERIVVRPVLRPMTDEDARGFIRHLLNEPRRIAGQLLADDAEREVLRLADGRPERIGALVRSTLMLGDLVRPQLSAEMVRTTAQMLDGPPEPAGRRRASIRRPALAAALGVAVAGGLAIASRDGRLEPVLLAARSVADHIIAGWTPPGDAAVAAPRPMPAPEPMPMPMPPDARDAPALGTMPTPGAGAASASGNGLPEAERTPDASEPEPAATAEEAAPPQAVPTAEAVPVPAPTLAPEPEPAPPPPPVLEAEPAGAGPNASAMPGAPAALAPGVVATLLRRGDEMLALGDVSAARRFYARTIPGGSALGARGVARTYDPAVLGRSNPAADPSAAAAWYDRAAQLEMR